MLELSSLILVRLEIFGDFDEELFRAEYSKQRFIIKGTKLNKSNGFECS